MESAGEEEPPIALPIDEGMGLVMAKVILEDIFDWMTEGIMNQYVQQTWKQYCCLDITENQCTALAMIDIVHDPHHDDECPDEEEPVSLYDVSSRRR